ncbi:hypothetical protein LTR27_005206 [Elasticomyces elasticus]|nr:hypothetical protein LTR27_005206 [Elasticomyces elasticus]
MDAPGQQAEVLDAQDLKQDQESFMRTIGGAVVQFGEGGSVCRLSLIWEALIVRIGGIPPFATVESLRDLLQTPEHPIAMDSVQVNTTTACAYISCEDPASADTLCQQSAAQFGLGPAHCDLTFQSLMPRNTSSTTTQRISCKKVIVSWYRATRLVWLNFGRQQIAQRVCDKFNSGKYTIGDRRIQAVVPKQSGGTPRNPVAWTVMLQDVSVGAGKDEINASIWSTAEKPRHIELAPSAASSDILCTMADASGGEFSISCQGDMGACKKLLPLIELQNLLSSDALETSLETSFASYIRRRPQDFRYCPTPDCGYIYRASNKARTHTCIKCFEAICTACHERHPTISCAEYKYLASGDQAVFDKYKKTMNMKDCPKCKTVMEKTEGCNHMVCGGCRIHICWICLATFPTSGLCYKHLSEVHGGCFDVLRV